MFCEFTSPGRASCFPQGRKIDITIVSGVIKIYPYQCSAKSVDIDFYHLVDVIPVNSHHLSTVNSNGVGTMCVTFSSVNRTNIEALEERTPRWFMSAACQAPKSVGSAASAGAAASAAVRSSGSAGTGTAWAQARAAQAQGGQPGRSTGSAGRGRSRRGSSQAPITC